MAWTAPRTWVSGEIVTAANMNTHVRDNMKAIGGADKAWCRVYNSATQSIPDNAITAVTFDSEQSDVQAMHSTSSNTSRITVPASWGGPYLIGSQVNFAGVAASDIAAAIRINNVNDLIYGTGVTSTVITGGIPLCTLNTLAAGDYVETRVYQKSGAALNTALVTGASPMFWAIWTGSG